MSSPYLNPWKIVLFLLLTHIVSFLLSPADPGSMLIYWFIIAATSAISVWIFHPKVKEEEQHAGAAPSERAT